MLYHSKFDNNAGGGGGCDGTEEKNPGLAVLMTLPQETSALLIYLL